MDTIIQYSSVVVSSQKKQILKDVNLHLSPGEFVVLSGEVGSGKTSLLRSFYSDMNISGEEAKVLGYDLLKLKKKQRPFLRRKIGFIFQDFKFLQDRNIKENLRFVLKATGWTDEDDINQRIEEVLSEVNLQDKQKTMPHLISGGEQQRLSFARAMLNKPKLILADEPTSNLDSKTSEYICQKLWEQTQNSTAVVMATHDKNLIKTFSNATLPYSVFSLQPSERVSRC